MSAPVRVEAVADEADWASAQAIRTRVFIEEQACPPDEEWDGFDETSRHFLAYVGDEPVATARWRTVPHGGRLAAKLERFAVVPEHRGRGLGRRLVAAVIADAERAGFAVQMLHAQAHLEAFYASFGFARTSGVFEEAGIPHVEMVRGGLQVAG